MGNSAGVLALVYNIMNSTIGYYRGKHDAFSSLSAGAVSGILFKSTRGVRPMMISGVIVAGVAGSWTVSSFISEILFALTCPLAGEKGCSLIWAYSFYSIAS